MLSDYEMMTTGQLSKKIFGDIALTTILRRFRKLEKGKWIRRIRGLESGELVWTITDYAAFKLGRKGFIDKINKNQLEHDLLVTQARIHFEKSPLISNWKTEQAIRRSADPGQYGSLNPDGLFAISTNKGPKIGALEVEISRKKFSRYEEIFYNYKHKENIAMVCYVVTSDAFGRALAKRWDETAMSRLSYEESKCKFFWICLSDLFNSKSAINLQSLKKPLSLTLS